MITGLPTKLSDLVDLFKSKVSYKKSVGAWMRAVLLIGIVSDHSRC